jgi:hypothetical protein
MEAVLNIAINPTRTGGIVARARGAAPQNWALRPPQKIPL